MGARGRSWARTKKLPLAFLVKEAGQAGEKRYSSDPVIKRRQLHPPPYLSPGECRTCGASGSEPCEGLSSGHVYASYRHQDRDANGLV